MRFRLATMIWMGVMTAGPVSAVAAQTRLTVLIGGLAADQHLPARAAFCAAQGADPQSYNISPAVRWSKGPAATRSYALLMLDPDVPADLTLIDRPGVTIPAHARRQSFYHWVLADIPSTVHALGEGVDGRGLVAHGKQIGAGPAGRRGANDYSRFLQNMPSMAGTYGGYDGPCPPRNDARTHRYVVTVYALDVPKIGLADAFDGQAVERAMAGHILARGSATGLYDRRTD